MKKVLFLLLLLPVFPSLAQEKEMVGWKERLVIYPEKITIHAKIDTGADSSALDAEDIVEFKKDGRKWIRFTVKNRFGEQVRMERPLKRNTLIKQHESDSQSRPVISLGICLAGAYMEEDVSLVNRSHFTTQMLVGRTFTAGTAIIDPAQTYISEPNCQNIPEAKVIEVGSKPPKKKAPVIKPEDLKEEVVVEGEKEGNE